MEEQQKQQEVTIKMLYFAFIGALFMYLFVVYQKLSEKNQPFYFQTDDLFSGLFLGVFFLSLILIAIAHFYISSWIKGTEEKKFLLVRLFQFALSEAVGFFGVVLFFYNGSLTQFATLWLISIVSLIFLFPQKETV